MRRVESVPVGIGGSDNGQTPTPGPEAIEYMRRLTTHEWAVVVTWDIDDGRAVPSAVTLHALRGQPINSTAWRRVNAREVIEIARQRTAALHDEVKATFRGAVAVLPDVSRGALDRGPQASGRGRPADYDDAHYARVAEAYNEAVRLGSRSPVQAVARLFGVAGTSDHPNYKAKGWVAEARRRGYITKGGE